jgi:hypothetical protein
MELSAGGLVVMTDFAKAESALYSPQYSTGRGGRDGIGIPGVRPRTVSQTAPGRRGGSKCTLGPAGDRAPRSRSRAAGAAGLARLARRSSFASCRAKIWRRRKSRSLSASSPSRPWRCWSPSAAFCAPTSCVPSTRLNRYTPSTSLRRGCASRCARSWNLTWNPTSNPTKKPTSDHKGCAPWLPLARDSQHAWRDRRGGLSRADSPVAPRGSAFHA